MAINKVVYGGEVLIDLTGDTITSDKMLKGYKAHDKSGSSITGTCDFDVNSQDATAAIAEVLTGKTFYARGQRYSGTMPNNGAVDVDITTLDQEVIIPQGYHDGSGTVSINATEQSKIIAGNIKRGITILGVEGTCEPSSDVTVQSKVVTPSTAQKVILPDSGVDYLSQVTVNAIPYTEAENSAGGYTATIG